MCNKWQNYVKDINNFWTIEARKKPKNILKKKNT